MNCLILGNILCVKSTLFDNIAIFLLISTSMRYGLNDCVPPEFICGNPNSCGDGVRTWAFGWLAYVALDRPLMIEISDLLREQFISFTTRGHREEMLSVSQELGP